MRGQPVGRTHAVEQHQAAGALERQIEHHECRLAHLDRPQSLGHTARAGHAEPVRGQVVEQEGTREVVVLDDEQRAQVGHTRNNTARENLAPATARGLGGRSRKP